ncbi:MAG TPA: hypothetical protein VMR33_16075 [Candidatus Baltobacteraceae bacterium]|jgi:hypothetical protein|nr:hypothetical protein [Candidatus Baltobacteraceae bacterium]
MPDRIQPDPDALQDLLSQPAVTRLEVLRQVRESVPLHPNAQRELEQLELEQKNLVSPRQCREPSA